MCTKSNGLIFLYSCIAWTKVEFFTGWILWVCFLWRLRCWTQPNFFPQMSQICFVKPLCTVSICCCNLQFLLITLRQIGQVFVCPSCTHCLCLCKLDMVPNEFPPRETKKKVWFYGALYHLCARTPNWPVHYTGSFFSNPRKLGHILAKLRPVT